MSLAKYNKDVLEDGSQSVIDAGLKKVNDNIVGLNAAFKKHTPMIHQYVHKSMGHGKFKNAYGKLVDGLHPKGNLLMYINCSCSMDR